MQDSRDVQTSRFFCVSKKRNRTPQGWFDGEAVRELCSGNPSALYRINCVSKKRNRTPQGWFDTARCA